MNRGRFIGVGVGPGDSELLTVKTVRYLKEADVIICPEKKEGSGSFALDIAKEYIDMDKVAYMTFPMHYDVDELKKKWSSNADEIQDLVSNGKMVVFITLGDPTVFSTYMYLLDYLRETDLSIETVPGITSFCNMASSMNIPIAEWEEGFSVVPLRKSVDEKLINALDNFENVVIMKPSNDGKALAKVLKEKGLENNFVLVTKSGTDKEVRIKDIRYLEEEKIPYLSTIIVKKNGKL